MWHNKCLNKNMYETKTLINPWNNPNIDSLFTSLIHDSSTTNSLSTLVKSSYADEKGNFEIDFRVPGYEKDEVKISIDKSKSGSKILNIRAENKEFGILKISQSILADFDESKIKATLKNGILKISSIVKTKSLSIQID